MVIISKLWSCRFLPFFPMLLGFCLPEDTTNSKQVAIRKLYPTILMQHSKSRYQCSPSNFRLLVCAKNCVCVAFRENKKLSSDCGMPILS